MRAGASPGQALPYEVGRQSDPKSGGDPRHGDESLSGGGNYPMEMPCLRRAVIRALLAMPKLREPARAVSDRYPLITASHHAGHRTRFDRYGRMEKEERGQLQRSFRAHITGAGEQLKKQPPRTASPGGHPNGFMRTRLLDQDLNLEPSG